MRSYCKGLHFWLAGVLVMVAPGMACSVTPMRQAFLIQNSGWMEPFYEDPASPFKALVVQLSDAAAGDGEVVVGMFNQADAEHPSPMWIYRGPGSHAGLGQSLAKQQLARKLSGAYADTDFKEALLGAIEVGLESRPGIVWIVTNNKNSPNNSGAVVERNREFYQLLHEEPAVSRISVFPLRMPVQGRHYRANGLMLYAIAYGEQASTFLQHALDRPALKRLLPEGYVRLKPLTEAAVRFNPTGVKDSADIAAGLASDGTTLVLSFNASTDVRTAQISGRFENLFNPYQITHARISLMTPPEIGLQGSISSSALKALEPGRQSDELSLALSLPALPSPWSREVLLRSGYERRGAIDIRLDDQELTVSPAFIAHMGELFPGDTLPEVFLPPVKATSSVTRVPLLLRVQYPTWPAIVVYGGGVLLLLGALLGAALLSGARNYTLLLDGQPRQYRLKPFTRAPVIDDQGQQVATVQRGLGGVRIVTIRPDTTIRLK